MHVGVFLHRLLRVPTGENSAKRVVLLVITSDRSPVGVYNSNVLPMASEFIRHGRPSPLPWRFTSGEGKTSHIGFGRLVAQGRSRWASSRLPLRQGVRRTAVSVPRELIDPTDPATLPPTDRVAKAAAILAACVNPTSSCGEPTVRRCCSN